MIGINNQKNYIFLMKISKKRALKNIISHYHKAEKFNGEIFGQFVS